MSSTRPKKFCKVIPSAKYTHIVKGCGRDVLAALVEVLLLEHSSKTTVSEKLQDIGIYDEFKKKKGRDEIDKNEPLETKDVTFLFSIYDKLWEKIDPKHKDLKDLMWKIKDERNNVSHKDLSLTQTQLEQKLKDFGMTLKKALAEAEKLYPSKHSTTLTTIENNVDQDLVEILEKVREELDPSKPEDYKKHKEEQESFRPLATKSIQDKSRINLMSHLQTHCKSLLLNWLTCRYGGATDTSNMSVSLMMETEKEFHGIPSGESPMIMDQKELLQTRGPKGGEATVVIISGDAGAGKTTILSCMVEKWIKEEMDDFPGLFHYPILLYIEFRNRDFDNLDNYLHAVLRDVIADYDFETVKSAIFRSRCLILSDGFDEKNDKSMKMFREILGLYSVGTKIIVTTRPINTKDLTDIVDKFKKSRVNLTLLGIPDKYVVQSITKVTDIVVSDATKRQETIENITEAFASMAPQMRPLVRIPLYNNLVIVLLIECPELRRSINTVTKLFLEVKKHELQRLLDKIGSQYQEKDVLQFQKLYCMKSLKTHLERKHELNEEDIQTFRDECLRSGLPLHDVMSTYFSTKYSVNPEDPKSLELKKTFCYKHRTAQEFSAAGGICDMLINKDSVYDSIHKQINKDIIFSCLSSIVPQIQEEMEEARKRMQNILAFLTGMLVNLKLIDRYIVSILNFVHLGDQNKFCIVDPLLHLLCESENNAKVNEAIASKLQSEGRIRWKLNDSTHLSSLAALQSQIKPKELFLEFSNDPESMPHLIPVLQSASSNKTSVDLFLWSHFKGQASNYSDKYYLEIAERGRKFMGCLSVSAIPFISEDIYHLWLKLDKQTLPVFSSRLPSLTHLSILSLRICIREIDNPDTVSSLEYAGRALCILLDMTGQNGDSEAHFCAKAFNSLWPRIQGQESGFRDSETSRMFISNSHFSKIGVETFLRSLKMKNLYNIAVINTLDMTEDDRGSLTKLSKDLFVGSLSLR